MNALLLTLSLATIPPIAVLEPGEGDIADVLRAVQADAAVIPELREAREGYLREVTSRRLAQAMRPNLVFSGGTLTDPLVLDADNTTCAQALSLSFTGDADLGLQRAAANTLRICASSGVIFNGPVVATEVGNCAAADIQFAGSAGRGFAFDAAAGRVFVCLGGNPVMNFAATALTGASAYSVLLAGTGAYKHSGTAAGTNARVESDANASGEIAVSTGSTAALAAATLDTTLLSACHDCDGTPTHVFKVDGNGHILTAGPAPTYTAGTCTNETGTGDDTKGTITMDCTAGQTGIVTFSRAHGANVSCTWSPANAAAAPAAAERNFGIGAAATFTYTATTAITGGTISFHCIE